MGIKRKTVSAAIITAMLATTATPAFARDGGFYGGGSYGGGYGGGYGNYGHRRHHDRGVSAGDVIAGIAVIGVIAAIASAASKRKTERYPDRADNRYPPADNRAVDRDRGSIATENAAVDACATAAEQRGGSTASVREITAVDRSSDGWDIEGIVEQRDGWRDRTGDQKRFTCSVRYGAVDSLYIDSDTFASR